MYVKFVAPKYRRMKLLPKFCQLFVKERDEVHYIGGAEVLPPPLAGEEEAVCINLLGSEHPEYARKRLIEHN